MNYYFPVYYCEVALKQFLLYKARIKSLVHAIYLQ